MRNQRYSRYHGQARGGCLKSFLAVLGIFIIGIPICVLIGNSSGNPSNGIWGVLVVIIIAIYVAATMLD